MLTYLVDALMNVYSSLCPGSTKRSHRAWRRLRSQQAGSCVSGPPTLMRQRRAFGGTGTPFGLFPFGLFVVLVCSVHLQIRYLKAAILDPRQSQPGGSPIDLLVVLPSRTATKAAKAASQL